MLKQIQGYKTYIIVGLALLVVGANLMGFVNKESAESLILVLGLLGGVTISAKINRLNSVLGKMGQAPKE